MHTLCVCVCVYACSSMSVYVNVCMHFVYRVENVPNVQQERLLSIVEPSEEQVHSNPLELAKGLVQ